MADLEWCKSVGGKVELHRHLEGSIPFETIWKLQGQGKISTRFSSLEDVRKSVSLKEPMQSLEEVLDRFGIFQKCFCDPETTEQITHDVIVQAYAEGIWTLELRYSPKFICEDIETSDGEAYPSIWDRHFEAILRGRDSALALCPHMKVGFIIIVSRNYGPGSAMETARFAVAHRQDVIGFDLASTEQMYPVEAFRPAIQLIHQHQIPLTVHCGEGVPASYIEETLTHFAPVKRLGHATSITHRPDLIQTCLQQQIHIECNPTSNLITNSVLSLQEHPIHTLLEAGVSVSINTDDPALFDIDLNHEWALLKFDRQQLLRINEAARLSSFIQQV